METMKKVTMNHWNGRSHQLVGVACWYRYYRLVYRKRKTLILNWLKRKEMNIPA